MQFFFQGGFRRCGQSCLLRASLVAVLAIGMGSFAGQAANAQTEPIEFGSEMLLRGDTLVVSAHLAQRSRGMVYLLQRTRRGWTPAGRFVPTDRNTEGFGYALAMDEETLMVGAPLGIRGAVSAYRISARKRVNPRATQTVVFPDPSPHRNFGGAVAVRGDLAAVGASMAGRSPTDTDGAVYVYHRSNDGWELKQKLVAPGEPGEALGRHFGSGVKLTSHSLIVGAYMEDQDHPTDSAGAIYVHPLNAAGEIDEAGVERLMPPRGTGVRYLSGGLDATDDWIVAGAPLSTVEGQEHAGCILVFQRNPQGGYQPARIARLDPPVVQKGLEFGGSVAIMAPWLVVLTKSTPRSEGALYFYPWGDPGPESNRPAHSLSPRDGVWFRSGLAVGNSTIAIKTLRTNGGRGPMVEVVELYHSDGQSPFELQYTISPADGVKRVGKPVAP